MLALDTETTGIDFYHGTKPYLVTWCREDGVPDFMEWDVDPYTRDVTPPPSDLDRLSDIIWGVDGSSEEEIVGHNLKFDIHALSTILPEFEWLWHRTKDTIVAAHLLGSNHRLNLTDLTLHYIKLDIEPYEKELEDACKIARRHCRSKHKDWIIAQEGISCMPSIKKSAGSDKKGVETGKLWKCDMWLPRAVAKAEGYAEDHPWWTVLSNYAKLDSLATLTLWKTLEKEIARRKLGKIYACRLKSSMRVAYKIETRGVTTITDNLDKLEAEYREESNDAGAICVNIAKSYNVDLQLPANGVNNSLRDFMLETMELEPVYSHKSKTVAPTLDKTAMSFYEATLAPKSKPLLFVKSLLAKRARDTALSYMDGYKKFMLPFDGRCNVLHPSLNPTGTDHLRWTSSNPNEQNISKREGFNLRFGFGPAEDREWWSLDAKNIERRLPAYEAGEDESILLFEHPDDPPYFGSEHLLVAHILHKRLFEKCLGCAKCGMEIKVTESVCSSKSKFCECSQKEAYVDGRIFKKRYASTWYQFVKNGNFAIQYGCQKAMADRTYRVTGAYELIKSRFKKQEELNQKCINHAEKYGYVETIPDRSVDPDRGYPILCARTEYGRILPTVPLNYHVSGSAMWWMGRAMERCQEQLDTWLETTNFDAYMVMQVHDELVFDLPKSKTPPRPNEGIFRTSNLWRMKTIQRIMERGGDDIGIPTLVSIEYHPDNWAAGITF